MVSQERYEWLLNAWRSYFKDHPAVKPTILCYPNGDARHWMSEMGITPEEMEEVEFTLYLDLTDI